MHRPLNSQKETLSSTCFLKRESERVAGLVMSRVGDEGGPVPSRPHLVVGP